MEFIKQYWLFGLGFFAQALFGTRLLIQLFLSEKAGRVVSPVIFWQISLFASFLFFVYGVLRQDAVILLGQTLSYFIYIRNLQLKKAWVEIPYLVRLLVFLQPFASWSWLIYTGKASLILNETGYGDFIVLLGAVGQLTLNLRYLYQWYFSEKQNESVLPFGFWVISALASMLIVWYGFYRNDPVLLVAQSMGLVVYLRNMFLLRVRRKA